MDIEEIKDFRPLILVAEDDDSNFKLIKAIIGKKCDILWAKNGEEMLNLYREHTQDAHAILMDIKMPIMNGYEASRRIRELKDGNKSQIPIVAMTANAFEEDKKMALASGMNDHVAKPIDMNVLLPTIMKYM